MNESADQLAKSILQKNSVADCDLHELQQLAERYPYSAIHQALLLHKLKNEHVPGYTEQLGKTGLYFQHPLWLDQLLQGKGDAVVVEKQKTIEPVLSVPVVNEELEEAASMADIPTLNMDWASDTEGVKDNTITQQEEEQPLTATEADGETVHVPAADPVIPEQVEKEVIAENLQEKESLLTHTLQEETVHVHASGPVIPEQTKEVEAVQPEDEMVSNMDNAMSYAEKAGEEPVEVEIKEMVAEEEEPPTPLPPGWKEDLEKEAAAGEPEHIFSAVMETPQTEEPVVSNSNTMTEESISRTQPSQHQPPEESEMKIPSFTIEPIDPATAELNFQPFHTVDYFASQGIKFKEEEKPKDRFGQQLKSFTEWLKVLKKTPAAEVAGNISKNSELRVEQMAEHSIEGGEVLTETMAEVWEKQGNRQKASEIYRKLSLLNPSKSAYFAAKIEQLKNN